MNSTQSTPTLSEKDQTAIRLMADSVNRRRQQLHSVITDVRYWDASWDTIDDVDVLRVPGSAYVGVPLRKRSRYDIVHLDENGNEFICQVKSQEVRGWLARAAEREGLPPTSTATVTHTHDGNGNRVYR